MRLYVAETVSCIYLKDTTSCENCTWNNDSKIQKPCSEVTDLLIYYFVNTIKKNLFQVHFGNVTYLTIKFSQSIGSIDGFLNNATKLNSFNAKANYITHLTNESFHDAYELVKINLNENRIESIAGSTFAKLRKLKNLGLSNNLITQLDQHIFDSLVNLKMLYLTNNKIEVLAKRMLENKQQMEILNIDFQTFLNIYQYLQPNIINVLSKNVQFKIYLELTQKINNLKFNDFSLNSTKDDFLMFINTKKRFYNQVQSLMISYLVIILILFSFVGFVIFLFGKYTKHEEIIDVAKNETVEHEYRIDTKFQDVELRTKEPYYEDIDQNMKPADEEQIYCEIE